MFSCTDLINTEIDSKFYFKSGPIPNCGQVQITMFRLKSYTVHQYEFGSEHMRRAQVSFMADQMC